APLSLRLKMTARTDVRNITAFRLELLTDTNLPAGGPGRSATGLCALSEFEVEAAPKDSAEKPRTIKIARATADIALPETHTADESKKQKTTGGVELAIDG